jgi:thiamine-monophosphate kinase
MLGELDEIRRLKEWATPFRRHPDQAFGLGEADAEILRRPDGSCLVVKMDGISEEATLGLIRDPADLGAFAVHACLSDLAAAGADPLGALDSVVFPDAFDAAARDAFFRGLKAGLEDCATPLLGGDTGSGSEFHAQIVAIGTARAPIGRAGLREGDILYTTGLAGRGTALLASRLPPWSQTRLARDYRRFNPRARLRESKTMRDFASACLDTSDGFLNGCDLLARTSGARLVIDVGFRELLGTDLAACADECGVPLWSLLAGEFGDYELIFGVPAASEAAFLDRARADGWAPLRLGRVEAGEAALLLHTPDGGRKPYDAARVRNLVPLFTSDLPAYLERFFAAGREQGLLL